MWQKNYWNGSKRKEHTMAKLDFKEQMKRNTSRAKTELENDVTTPALDIFKPVDMSTPDVTDKNKAEQADKVKDMTGNEPLKKNESVKKAERTKRTRNTTKTDKMTNKLSYVPTDSKSMPGHPMADASHKYREYKKTRTNGKDENGEVLYVYQIRVTEQNKFWLYTYAAREDLPVYQVVRQIFSVMIPEYDKVDYTLTMEDFQPLNGGKQLTIYLTRQEIDALKNGARKKGLKLIHYIDKLFVRFREEYDPSFQKIASFSSDKK
jgi:hypothetical protein